MGPFIPPQRRCGATIGLFFMLEHLKWVCNWALRSTENRGQGKLVEKLNPSGGPALHDIRIPIGLVLPAQKLSLRPHRTHKTANVRER